jgi:hypothetical protein
VERVGGELKLGRSDAHGGAKATVKLRKAKA